MTGAEGSARLCVLLVEDDRTVSMVVSEMLATLGHDVINVESGLEALDCLKSPATVDLVLTDMVMPGGLSGDELIPMIEEVRPGTRRIVMSGYIPAERRDNLARQSDIVLLPKPFTMAQLKKALKDAH
ncbi:MAG: response regulator [Parvibaculum sp.]|nr:response regulator [Parvibaculum sp.]